MKLSGGDADILRSVTQRPFTDADCHFLHHSCT